jgi:gamma-glutamyltranspeptidase
MTLRSSVDVARKPVIAPNGVVAAGNQLAADAGVSMLERGGNAADAAVAAAFLAVVVEPWSCGIGGHRFGAVCRAVGRNRDPGPGNAGTRPRDAGHVRDRGGNECPGEPHRGRRCVALGGSRWPLASHDGAASVAQFSGPSQGDGILLTMVRRSRRIGRIEG